MGCYDGLTSDSDVTELEAMADEITGDGEDPDVRCHGVGYEWRCRLRKAQVGWPARRRVEIADFEQAISLQKSSGRGNTSFAERTTKPCSNGFDVMRAPHCAPMGNSKSGLTVPGGQAETRTLQSLLDECLIRLSPAQSGLVRLSPA